MPRYFTTHDLARVLGQSEATARRVLRELWPHRDAPTSWILGEGEWQRVLQHITENRARRFGRQRKRGGKQSL